MRISTIGAIVTVFLAGASSCHSDAASRELEPPEDPAAHIVDFREDLDYAQIVRVRADRTGDDTWSFSVTVRHKDEGWDHYADLWEVVDPRDGTVLGKRVLAHPHDNEQPFTRSQSGIDIPPALDHVIVRAKCTVHGYGGRAVKLNLSEVE